jgi:hypothetical protein
MRCRSCALTRPHAPRAAQFVQGHRCYDPHFWLEHESVYEATVESPCEPYFVALRAAVPQFDERFRGRFRDKVRRVGRGGVAYKRAVCATRARPLCRCPS